MRNNCNWCTILAVVTALFAMPLLIRAEIFYRVPGDFGWRKSVPIHLVLEQDVIDDLELSEENAQRLKELHQLIQNEVDSMRQRAPSNQRTVPKGDRWVRISPWNNHDLHIIRQRHADSIDQLLTEDQQERLNQIHLQMQRRATDALCDSCVAQEVGLTMEQRMAVLEQYRKVVQAEIREVKAGSRYTGPSSNDLDDECPEKVLKILTEEQRQQFERIRGKPLKRAEIQNR